ncbi:MAG TPA: RNA 2'-phosphotransferase [Phaeodactylibacter sp.]|nr:RNA 2'-phosphotransferase [Phaeodactylibacter sp.]
MTPQEIRKISKKLSLLLRHKPELYGLTLDRQGWCEVDALLAAFRQNGQILPQEVLETVVSQNDKRRFSFSEDGRRIRANQGHSIDVDLGYEAMQPPETLYHGTATRFLDRIFEVGLQKQQRHHVHLSPDVETASKVGARHGKLAILSIDANRMADDGHIFYRSANGVWLTDKVPVKYFQLYEVPPTTNRAPKELE